MTKQQFLSEYRAALPAAYPWAADAAKLDRFMDSVARTLAGEASWNHDSDVARTIWRAAGNTSKSFTLKALRALPEA